MVINFISLNSRYLSCVLANLRMKNNYFDAHLNLNKCISISFGMFVCPSECNRAHAHDEFHLDLCSVWETGCIWLALCIFWQILIVILQEWIHECSVFGTQLSACCSSCSVLFCILHIHSVCWTLV